MKFDSLSEIEVNVYNILMKHVINGKKFILTNSLPVCYNKLGHKYSKQEIIKSVNSLIHKKYVIQGSSLTREDVKLNINRQKIINFIRINPGVYNRSIRKSLNLGSNEFRWHMGILIKYDIIKKIPFMKSFGYFENRTFMNHEFDLFLLQNKKVKLIVDFLRNKEASPNDMKKSLEMHYNTIQKYLKILEERSIVSLSSKNNRNHRFYNLNDELLTKLRKIINGQLFIEFA